MQEGLLSIKQYFKFLAILSSAEFKNGGIFILFTGY
jgi:hypothetical protein